MAKFSNYNRAVYDELAPSYTTDYWRGDEEQAAGLLKPGKLLIGGVGAGRTILPLQRKGFSITAIDISPKMVRLCRERFPDVDVQVMDLQHTSFENDSFDSIFLPFHTICYVDDVYGALRELRRILKPGGVLVFTMVNQWYLKSVFDGSAFTRKRILLRAARDSTTMLWTMRANAMDVFRMRRIFKRVTVRGRISMQTLEQPNWKDRLLSTLPLLDKSLYFFCTK